MNPTSAPNSISFCPDCHQSIPTGRSKHPWCECGWSSEPDAWLKDVPKGKIKKRIERERQKAQRLAEEDKRLLGDLRNPKKSLGWKFYNIQALFLCLPVFIPGFLFWILFIAAEIWLLWIQSWKNAIFIALIGIGALIYTIISRSHRHSSDITVTRTQAPLLFEALDEVRTHFKIPPIEQIRFQLNANAGVSQKWKWTPRPHNELQLFLGIFTCYELNVTQLKAILAHEMGHISGKDTRLLMIVSQALNILSTWKKNTFMMFRGSLHHRNIFSPILFFGSLIAYYLISAYLSLLNRVAKRAMRRQEYLADRGAALIYGKNELLGALLNIGAVGIKYQEYLPTMIERFDNQLDQNDFCYQFVALWGKMNDEMRSASYAKAVASFRSVDDTHPSYKDRAKALEKIGDTQNFEDTRPASDLLPNPAEIGHKLTVQLLQARANRRH